MNKPNYIIEPHYYIVYNTPAGNIYSYDDGLWKLAFHGTCYTSYNDAVYVLKKIYAIVSRDFRESICIHKIEHYIALKQ